jgi:hypothetical protein
LNRYATESVLSQVLPIVEEHVGKWACAIQAPILAYLLRVNPEVARPRIEAAMAARGEEHSACNHSLLVDLGALQQSPMLEEIAVPSLDDSDPEVAGNAAAYLGKYGSPAAEQTLWEHLTRWNERWNGKAEELRYVPGEKNPFLWHNNLGTNLALALATGKSWLADQSKLARLRQLAVGADMQRQLDNILDGWERKPWTISYDRTGQQQHFRVLQYEMDSLDRIREKLAQFPPGSNFTWAGSGGPAADEKKLAHELSEFLATHAMKLTVPAN